MIVGVLSSSDTQKLLPPEYFGVQTPTGLSSLDVRAPKFVDAGEMSKLTTFMARNNLTVALNDWDQLAVQRKPGTEARTDGPLDFRFRDGDILVNLNLAIFRESWKPVNTVYGRDQVDIVSNWLVPRLLANTWIDTH